MQGLKFKSVSLRKLKVNGTVKGIAEYYPVAFDQNHFSVVNVGVHSTLMGMPIHI